MYLFKISVLIYVSTIFSKVDDMNNATPLDNQGSQQTDKHNNQMICHLTDSQRTLSSIEDWVWNSSRPMEMVSVRGGLNLAVWVDSHWLDVCTDSILNGVIEIYSKFTSCVKKFGPLIIQKMENNLFCSL